MKTHRTLRTILLSALLAVGNGAFAQVSFNIQIGPPAPLYEAVPVMAPGYVWAPGYWAWHGDRHIWVRGRSMYQRVGYRWEPDMWEQRGSSYYRHPGRWARDKDYRPVALVPKYDDRDDYHGKGKGKGKGKEKFKKDKREGK